MTLLTRRNIFGAAVVLAVSGFYLYDQRTPVEYRSGEVVSAWCDKERKDPPPETIRKGGCMKPVIGLFWHRVDCDLEVARSMRDGKGDDIKIPSDHSSATPSASVIGIVSISNRTVVLPGDAQPYKPPGPKPSYRGKMKLSCGILRKMVNPFEIEVGPIPFEFTD